jgi:hypothetical protein
MTTVCAWCPEPVIARPVESVTVSHGICPSCLDRQLRAAPASRPVRRPLRRPTLRWATPPPALGA